MNFVKIKTVTKYMKIFYVKVEKGKLISPDCKWLKKSRNGLLWLKMSGLVNPGIKWMGWTVLDKNGQNGKQRSKMAGMVSTGQKWPKWSVVVRNGRNGQLW